MNVDWVSEFAPRSQSKFLSYTVGWLAALGWQALVATTGESCDIFKGHKSRADRIAVCSPDGTLSSEHWMAYLFSM
jgi:hypothetical protein